MKLLKKSIKHCAIALAVASTAGIVTMPSAVAQNSEEAIKWRMQAHLPRGSGAWEDSLVAFKEEILDRTDGRLQIEVYPADALIPATEIFPAVKQGVIQMGYTSSGYLQSYIPTAGLAYTVPGAFDEVWEAAYFWKHLGFEDLIREEALEEGVYYFTEKLYPTEMVLKEPVGSLEDFSSLSLRSAGILQRFLTEVGASASYFSGTELYQALSTGVIDGAHWGASQEANSLSLYETAKYHVHPPLGIGGVEAFVINENAMESLPNNIQNTLKSVLEEHFWARTNEYQFQEIENLRNLEEEQGVTIIELPDDVQQKMKQVGRKIWDEEAKKSENAAEAVRRLKDFLAVLGRG
ncbi:TRAP transporter substrate-binding protein DctP [Halomonas aquamarina]|uniref:TRAP transporter substrate-binding protein DctP n=1 Tax=Vreelandella aquamarina TaxID=77097 RepID=UPI002358BE73|nr:TRAP transporter substrate-binding protein DctP [Halomonas aquamarina]MDC8442661.1 TRAP transporter substrate-binding protein DctP [Halomonas aquamarina]